MSVSVRQAFRNVFSEKYNKINCGLWLPIFIIMGAAGFLDKTNEFSPESLVKVMLVLILIPICYILNTGILYLSAHNAIFSHRKGVVPNLFKDFIKILLTGIKHFFGLIISSVLLGIPLLICGLIIIYGISSSNMPLIIGMIIIFIFAAIVLTLFYQCIIFNVFLTLKFGSWFNVGKAGKLWKSVSVKNRFAFFILKVIALYILFLILVVILSVIIAIPFGVLSAIGSMAGNASNAMNMLPASILISLVVGILNLILNLLYIDLTAQLINRAYPNIGKKSKKPISKRSNSPENNIKQDSQEK